MPRKSTRAAQGSGTIRERKDGRWEARVTLGRDPGTGKQVQKSVYGKTQGEVRKKLQQACVSVDEGTYTEPSRLTVGGWLDIWLEEYTGGLKPRSLRSYREHVNNHIRPALGAVKLSALNASAVQSMCNGLLKGRAGSPAFAPKTVKCIHGVLHKALEQAVELGYLRANPASSCKLPRAQRAEIRPLEDADASAFLRAIKGHPFEAVYTVDLFTGMRQGEILGLTWDCVDFKVGTIYVYRQLQRNDGVYGFVPLKNNKTRTLTPAPSVMRVLQEVKRTQAEWKLTAGSAWDNADNLVFTNQLGRHLATFTVYKHFKRIVQEIGLPDARFHDMRHTYAVAALQSGDDVKTVQENLGHHTAAFTLDVYGHVSEAMKKASAARMEAHIQKL